MSEKVKPEALIQVSKHRVEVLLDALKRYPNKADPSYKELVHELEDVAKYWGLIESIEIKSNEAIKNKYVNEAKKMPELTGDAKKRYLQKRGIIKKKDE